MVSCRVSGVTLFFLGWYKGQISLLLLVSFKFVYEEIFFCPLRMKDKWQTQTKSTRIARSALCFGSLSPRRAVSQQNRNSVEYRVATNMGKTMLNSSLRCIYYCPPASLLNRLPHLTRVPIPVIMYDVPNLPVCHTKIRGGFDGEKMGVRAWKVDGTHRGFTTNKPICVTSCSRTHS